MLKKVQVYWFFWYSYSSAVSVMCDAIQDTLVLFALLWVIEIR